MKVDELMRTKVVTLNEEDSIEDAFDLMVGEHIHGAPVIGADGQLVGVVSQLDIYFGRMTLERQRSKQAPDGDGKALKVKDVMTSPAVSAAEDTEIVDLCRMMYKLRIHRVPVVRDSEILGVVSSLDVCRAIADGRLGSSED